MSQETRLCMIGAGRHASAQVYPTFYQVQNARVVANCDLDLAAAERIGRKVGIERQYSDWRRMCAEEQPDGVMVCIGDALHAQLAQEIMRAGYHVYVEKPHADSLANSRAMLAVSESTGKICMGAYKKRHAPAYRKAKAHMQQPAFGDVCYLSCYRAMGGSDQRGGAFHWQWGCHVIDIVQWFMGPVARVQAFKNDQDFRATTVNLQFVSGACGNLTLASPGGNWEELTILGAGMHAVRVKDGWLCTAYHGNDPCDGYMPSFAASTNGAELMGFLGELQAFADGCRTGERPDGCIQDIHHTMAIYAAMERAIDSGAVETVEQLDLAIA